MDDTRDVPLSEVEPVPRGLIWVITTGPPDPPDGDVPVARIATAIFAVPEAL